MVRTSQCFRTEYSQLDGPWTLAAAEAIPCALALPASLIKPDYGVCPLDLSRRQELHFLASSLRSACRKACQFICLALPFRRFRRECPPLLRSLQGFGKLLFEATREIEIQATRTPGRKSAAPSVTAS
jgi:hypothetical protein